jgi:hypothetical protein
MSIFPENLEQYKNSYMWIEATKELRYIKYDGTYETVKIDNLNKFLKTLESINKKKANKIHLSQKQANELITSNEGHTRVGEFSNEMRKLFEEKKFPEKFKLLEKTFVFSYIGVWVPVVNDKPRGNDGNVKIVFDEEKSGSQGYPNEILIDLHLYKVENSISNPSFQLKKIIDAFFKELPTEGEENLLKQLQSLPVAERREKEEKPKAVGKKEKEKEKGKLTNDVNFSPIEYDGSLLEAPDQKESKKAQSQEKETKKEIRNPILGSGSPLNNHKPKKIEQEPAPTVKTKQFRH